MKKFIIAIMMVLISIGSLGAEDKETEDPAKDNTLMPLKVDLTLPAKYKYDFYKEGMTKETDKTDFLDCVEGQKRIIGFGRMGAGDKITNPLNEYEKEKINTSPFGWIFMPNIKEGQPEGIIRFSYSF
jgi:hypothetical protein